MPVAGRALWWLIVPFAASSERVDYLVAENKLLESRLTYERAQGQFYASLSDQQKQIFTQMKQAELTLGTAQKAADEALAKAKAACQKEFRPETGECVEKGQ